MKDFLSIQSLILPGGLSLTVTNCPAADEKTIFPGDTWQRRTPRDLPRTTTNSDDYLGIGSYGGGGNDQDFPGQGVYGFSWWFIAKMPGGDQMILSHLPDDVFCTIGHVGKEVMLIVPSWRLVVAGRGDWGGVRLEKTKLLKDAVATEPRSGQSK